MAPDTSQDTETPDSSKAAFMSNVIRVQGQFTLGNICANDRKEGRLGDLGVRDDVWYEAEWLPSWVAVWQEKPETTGSDFIQYDGSWVSVLNIVGPGVHPPYCGEQ